jgi:phosphate butyryltransferase
MAQNETTGEKMDQCAPRRKMAVAAAEDGSVLRAVSAAYQRGLVTPVLCGSEKKIKEIAENMQLDIAAFEIINCETAREAVGAAISLVREDRCGILMKGHVKTADLLRAVLDKEKGLRNGSILSHVSILDSPILKRRFLLTDAAMVTYPDLGRKVELINNAVKAARGLGIQNPKVAVLAAVEVVNPDMPATLDAAALTAMNRRGQLAGCVVDGPLAMDLALSEEAARHKNVASEAAGRADILLVPNIDAGNMALKAFIYGGKCLFGGLVMGARVPVLANSRSDSAESRLFSIECAAAIGNWSGQGAEN